MSLPLEPPPSLPEPLLLSLQSAVNCFQLNCLPFSRHPFAARHRLFAPFNVARFRDSPNFPPAGKESESAGEEGKGSSRLRPRRRGVNARKFPTEGEGVCAWRIARQISVESCERIFARRERRKVSVRSNVAIKIIFRWNRSFSTLLAGHLKPTRLKYN